MRASDDLFRIKDVDALQVLDSRGDPTIEVAVITEGGFGRAIAPSGASRGTHEAYELRDNNPEVYRGRSVYKAVENVKNFVKPILIGLDSRDQRYIDELLIKTDGTENKSRLGGNVTTAVSLAVLKAAADTYKMPVFRYIGGLRSFKIPIPMMNIINGGVHAGNRLSFQEFMIVPIKFLRFSDALRAGVEIYKILKDVIKSKYGASAVNVGDEGGYSPPLSKTEDALKLLTEAVERSRYSLGEEVFISLDCAASQFYVRDKDVYEVDDKKLSAEELLEFYLYLIDQYKIFSIEDPFHEDDYENFSRLVSKVKNTKIVGDDLLTTNIKRLEKSIERKSVTAALVKINQIGTFTETINFVELAKRNNLITIMSHRSGDSEDNILSHLAVGLDAEFIKTGAPARSERTAKYNELLRIEHYLNDEAVYHGSIIKI
ncbi:MAG: phosphopyruvate hydratase [Desulfurococcaceae archaeon]|nr:phosphopyruvate hydratase [Desulfurococcaceae archaeon]